MVRRRQFFFFLCFFSCRCFDFRDYAKNSGLESLSKRCWSNLIKYEQSSVAAEIAQYSNVNQRRCTPKSFPQC